MNTERSPRELVALLLRRKQQVVAVALAAFLVAAGVAVVKPRNYRAHTSLRIQGTPGLDGREFVDKVHGVTRDIKNQANMSDVVSGLNLDAHLQGLPEHERADRRAGLVAELVNQTDVEKLESAPGVWVVTISHTSPDPEIAYRVVSKLASGYKDSTYKGPVEQQERVVQQRQEEEDEARREYERLVAELDAFDKENAGFLDSPEKRLEAVQTQIEDVEKVEIASLETEILRLQKMLEEEPPYHVEEVEIRNEDLIGAVEKQIREGEATITQLMVEQNKTERHPAVRAQMTILRDLQQKLAEARLDVRIETRKTPNEMHPALSQQLIAAESGLARARRQLSVLRNKEAELLKDTRLAPEIKSTRERMARDVTVARQTLEERQNRHTLAREQLQVVLSQRQLEFNTIDPPTRPKGPSGPGALLIAFLGLAVGIAGGVGLAYVLDTTDHSFREVDQVTSYLGLPSLGAIHVIRTPAEEAARTRRGRQIAAAFVVVALVAIALLGVAMLGGGALPGAVEAVR